MILFSLIVLNDVYKWNIRKIFNSLNIKYGKLEELVKNINIIYNKYPI